MENGTDVLLDDPENKSVPFFAHQFNGGLAPARAEEKLNTTIPLGTSLQGDSPMHHHCTATSSSS